MVTPAQQIAQLAQGLALKPPRKNAAVHKAECIYSTDTEKSPDGLYINLKSFESFGKELLRFDRNAKGALYLHVVRRLVPRKPEAITENDSSANEEAVNHEASGDGVADDAGMSQEKEAVYVAGGSELMRFSFKQRKTCDEVVDYRVYAPSIQVSIPLDEAPDNVAAVCNAIIDHSGFNFSADDFVWKDYVTESKYAKHLIQVEAPPKINYENPQCERCGARTNLWLNLSDGYIGCGRKNYDAGGCSDGDEGAAIQHYQATGGVFPLAVKIGTITASSGDVYSYAPDEDTQVVDPYLADHLAHFGIDVKQLKETEKSTLQLEIEKNEKHDWSEMNSESHVVHGAGLVGLDNLGNSCYLNSAMQMLASVPDLASYFCEHYDSIATRVPDTVKPCDDVLIQFAKTVKAMTTSRVVDQQLELIRRYRTACEDEHVDFVEPEQYKNFAVKPSMLKYAIGIKNKSFATNDQQDAEEFFSYFLNVLADMEPEINRRAKTPCKIKKMFFFQYRQYIVCEALNKITYNDNEMHMLCLPLITGGMSQEDIDPNQPINIMDCFNYWEQEQEIDYLDKGQHHTGIITNALLTLPKYLVVKLNRFYFKADGTSEKITNNVVIPSEGITLETQGERPRGGYTVECNTREVKKAKKQMNPELLQTLMAMGFTEKLCRLAGEHADSHNVDACVNWILANMDTVSQDTATGENDASELAVNASVLMDLGYSLEQANRAAERFGSDVAAAVDWLATAELTVQATVKDKGKYQLLSVISHVGSKINTGHYVCHVNKNGQWYTFNDSKVLKYDMPSTGNGYLYLFKRSDDNKAASSVSRA
ncbi:ubiquitin carboxyl-terminal hydrolase, putative [Babesia bigemina]|uniref:Ubiquitin carboxyl-terminal hydrolase n=1 Tax=Babesia bigemina TaxID=5866 RepID=A0A061D7G4_BABBI|nr:ubiquitin carboxyl-terminal hydrolase, putative [Babesia bigemina]CDR95922.1 ubiquitin carboxyl-terminal hydrolase, putative [Babesia bigemina]|eukprot:XP_012768108.1 ubiquitin carboxyl-terminal hydrolase, putative [Babesia bigemina]